MPSKNIVDFANQVKSYALGIKDQRVLGAWNLLKNDGLATSTTEGATFTKNADFSVTINRETATTNASYYNITGGSNGEVTETRESGTYYISGVPSGSTGLTLQYYDVTANQAWNDSGSGAEITVVKGHTIKVSMRVAPNQTLLNVTVKPMISLEPNQPYVPYAMTNMELTENKANYSTATNATTGDAVSYQRVLTSSDDLDNLFQTGIFGLQTSLPSNLPSDWAGWGYILSLNMGFRLQFALTTNAIYIRGYGGSPIHWFAWQKLTASPIT